MKTGFFQGQRRCRQRTTLAESTSMPRLFCFGHSYTAKALIRRLKESSQDWGFIATVRETSEMVALEADGVEACLFGSPESRAALASASHILTSVPPGFDGDPVIEVYADALAGANALWLGYLSTTGPYGDHGGAWIDEGAPSHPSGKRGQARLDAEQAWQKLCNANSLPLHIFRLPGLYGPGRSALERMRNGTARRIVKKGQVFSRIHIDDLAAILAASMANPKAGALYNIADDLPAPPQDVISFAAELLDMTPPPEIDFETADLSPMARSFYSDSKRISNQLIKSELGIKLAWPTYREGLRAILAAEE